MNSETESNLDEYPIWNRGIYMLLFLFCLWLAKFVAFAVIVLQFLMVVFTKSMNSKLLDFGQSLSTYQYQVMLFLTFNNEEHPYPLNDWPVGPPEKNEQTGPGLET